MSAKVGIGAHISLDDSAVPRPPRGHYACWRQALPTLFLGLLLSWFILVPLFLLLVTAFKPTGLIADPGFTINHIVWVYGSSRFWTLALRTAIFAAGSAAAALIVGGILAWLVERSDLPARSFIRLAVILPMATPPFLLAIGWIMLLSPRTGAINAVLTASLGLAGPPFDIFSLSGMIFVETLAIVPSVFLILAPVFRNLDPSLEEAGLMSGAGPLRVMRRVVLPLAAPALAAATIYLVIVGFVTFDVPATIGMPSRIMLLSTEIYSLANDNPSGIPDYGRISAMSLVFIAGLMGLALAYQRLTRRGARFVTVSGKAFRSRPFRLGRWKGIAIAGVTLYFLLASIAPLAMLIFMSLMPYQAPVTIESIALVTVANHVQLFQNPAILHTAWHSLIIAIGVASAVPIVALVVSWVVVRSKAPGRWLLDLIAFLPMAIPGVLLATALIYTYLVVTVLPIYGSVSIIAIAYFTVYLSFGTRSTNSVLMQMHPELEEAARIGGAGLVRSLRRITVPLATPALAAVWIWVFAHCLRELSSALMLQAQDNATLTTQLFTYWSQGQPTTAAAIGVWLVLCLAVMLGASQALSIAAARRAAAPRTT